MRIHHCLALALFFLPAACGGDSHQALAKEFSGVMGQIATALESVTDVKSAQAAATKIKALAPTVDSLTKKMKALPEPDEAAQAKMGEVTATMQKEQQRLMAAMTKHMDNEEIMKILGDAIESLDMPGK